MNDIVVWAAEFAREAHVSIDQRRKYSGDPYIVHPQAVAGIVTSVTADCATIAAAWLHDVVEDTLVTIEEIEAEFGPDVARLVSGVTNTSKGKGLNRRQRRELDRQRAATIDSRAKTVKLADIIDNLRDIVDHDPNFARVYLPEKRAMLDVLADGDPALLAQARRMVDDLLARLGEGREE